MRRGEKDLLIDGFGTQNESFLLIIGSKFLARSEPDSDAKMLEDPGPIKNLINKNQEYSKCFDFFNHFAVRSDILWGLGS